MIIKSTIAQFLPPTHVLCSPQGCQAWEPLPQRSFQAFASRHYVPQRLKRSHRPCPALRSSTPCLYLLPTFLAQTGMQQGPQPPRASLGARLGARGRVTPAPSPTCPARGKAPLPPARSGSELPEKQQRPSPRPSPAGTPGTHPSDDGGVPGPEQQQQQQRDEEEEAPHRAVRAPRAAGAGAGRGEPEPEPAAGLLPPL